MGDVHLIRFADSAASTRERFPAGLLLRSGDYLVGALSGGDSDKLVLAHTLLGRLDIPIDSIRLLLPRESDIPADFQRYAPAAGEDVVYRKREGGFGEDFIRGTVDLFTREGLSFDCSLGLVEFEYTQLNAVVIAGAEEPAPTAAGAAVTALLKGGAGRLSGSLVDLRSESLLIRNSALGELSLSLDTVESLTFLHAGMVYLSDLIPVEVKEEPYLGEASEFLYPYKRDRSVTGRELSCGQKRFAKGLGVHARCSLTFGLDGGFSSFQSFVGLSDEVLDLRARGSIVFRVLVDGREAFQSPVLRGGGQALRLPPVDVKGAQRLTLEALYADGFDSGDRGLWGQALLVR
jgi:hypothetical protein